MVQPAERQCDLVWCGVLALQVLRFFTVWDDRDSLYGDLLHFKVHYYLVDDSMEIVPVFGRNRCAHIDAQPT
jgi:hypothetical protein